MVLVSGWLMKARLPFKSVVVHPVICDAEGLRRLRPRLM